MKFDQDGWLDVAQEYNISDNSWDRGGVSISHLVIHGTAGGSNGNDTLAYEASVGVSTHFALSINGDIWQGVPCTNKAAWGNAPLMSPTLNFARADLNPNLWTISIEFCKSDTTNQINITDAQKSSGFALIAAICDNYNIPKRQGDGNGGIIRHADINSIDRAHCPGTFPFDDLWTYLQTQGGPMVPQGWTDNGATLTAPNGHTVTLGFRNYVLNNNWDSNNYPLEEAHAENPLELSNPGLGNGTQQVFRTTVLEWTPTGGVFVSWVGQELLKMRSLLTQNAPQTPVVTLNTQQAISTIQAVTTALQSAIPALQSAAKDLEPS